MAEFCLDCWNEINNTDYEASHFVISKEKDLCEGCGGIRNVVIAERTFSFSQIFLKFLK